MAREAIASDKNPRSDHNPSERFFPLSGKTLRSDGRDLSDVTWSPVSNGCSVCRTAVCYQGIAFLVDTMAALDWTGENGRGV